MKPLEQKNVAEFARIVKRLRDFGLPVQDIADIANVSVRTLYRFSEGKTVVSVEDVLHLQCALLGIMALRTVALNDPKYDLRTVNA